MKQFIKWLKILVWALFIASWLIFGIPLGVFLYMLFSENVYYFIHEEEQQKCMEQIAQKKNFGDFEDDRSVSIIKCAGKAKMAVLAYKSNFSDYQDVTFVFDDGTLKRYIREEHVYVPRNLSYIHRILEFSDDNSGIKLNSGRPLKYINNIDSQEYRQWQEKAYVTFKDASDEVMKINGFKKIEK